MMAGGPTIIGSRRRRLKQTNGRQAWSMFWRKLERLIPTMALVSQCYTDYFWQPLLIRRSNPDVAFVRWTQERGATGLMFMADELNALNSLLTSSKIPDQFFRYWHDATNTTGYASKLLLMLFALEALSKNKKREAQRPKELV